MQNESTPLMTALLPIPARRYIIMDEGRGENQANRNDGSAISGLRFKPAAVQTRSPGCDQLAHAAANSRTGGGPLAHILR